MFVKAILIFLLSIFFVQANAGIGEPSQEKRCNDWDQMDFPVCRELKDLFLKHDIYSIDDLKKDENSFSLLDSSIKNHDFERAQTLIDLGANIQVDFNHNRLLARAIVDNDILAIDFLLDSIHFEGAKDVSYAIGNLPIRIHYESRDYSEALIYAIRKLPEPLVSEKWLNVLASAYGTLNFRITWELLKKINVDNPFDVPIMLASWENDQPIIPFTHRVATNYFNADQEIGSLLRLNRLPVHDSNGFPLICYAALKGDMALLTKLIKNGFDINIQDKDGNTAIMLATFAGNKKAVEILFNYNADLNLVNKENMNVISMATQRQKTVYNRLQIDDSANIKFIKDLIRVGVDYGIVDNYGSNPLDFLIAGFVNGLLNKMQQIYANDEVPTEISPNEIFVDLEGENKELAQIIMEHSESHIAELVIKKLKGESVQNFRKDGPDGKNIYIGIASAVGYYSVDPFKMATAMMSKHKDVKVRIITPDMVNEEFIKQFDGLIVSGGADNFPKDKNEFTLRDLDQETMLGLEKLYQQVIELADKNGIPTFGMCAGNQHITLYHGGTLIPVDNYNEDTPENSKKNKHEAVFVRGSIPHFLTLAPEEQRNALEKCILPEMSLSIITNHHYAGKRDKLGKLKLGAISEEGITQSVYRGTRFVGFQFHPENFYSSLLTPSRDRLIWENFLELCRQHRRYFLYAQENNLNIKDVLEIRDRQNMEIIDRLEECAKNNPPVEKSPHLNEALSFFNRVARKYNLALKEMAEHFMKMYGSDATEEEKNILQALAEEMSYSDNPEALPGRKDLCNNEKFQWSDYDLLDIWAINAYSNATCSVMRVD